MAVRKPSQTKDIAQAAAQLGAFAEGLTKKFGPAPKSHAKVAELEGIAKAAGVFWHALRENGVPDEFRALMFDNWQASLWGSSDVGMACEIDVEGEPA